VADDFFFLFFLVVEAFVSEGFVVVARTRPPNNTNERTMGEMAIAIFIDYTGASN